MFGIITGIKKIGENLRIAFLVKTVLCILIVLWVGNCIWLEDFYSYKDYSFKNNIAGPIPVENAENIEQFFVAKGNILTNISLYFSPAYGTELSIAIMDSMNRVVVSKTVNPADYSPDAWNNISIDYKGLRKDDTYRVSLRGEDLSYLFLSPNNSFPKVFGGCLVDGESVPYTLAIELSETYRYMTFGYMLELVSRILMIAFMVTVLCYSIWNFRNLYIGYQESQYKKISLLYAIYFSVTTALLFNPLDEKRNRPIEFSRVMGMGFNEGFDVTKRISNFNHWFLSFAIAFILFFLIANHFRKINFRGENRKAIELLDDIIIAGNVLLVLKVITFFYAESKNSDFFSYSYLFVTQVIICIILYVVLGLEKKISLDSFEALNVASWMLSFPVSISICHEWDSGRAFYGLQLLSTIAILLGVNFVKRGWIKSALSKTLNSIVVFFSTIPFFTSLFIEFVIWLNQREIFLGNLRRIYFFAICVGIPMACIVCFLLSRKNKVIKNWKSLAYPSIIVGFICLWVQIPVSSEYYLDMFESANTSVLIGDFLNFGDIPIVQHYGGHMMSGVWEGLIYAFLNNDYIGATFSPYRGYVAVMICLAFYFVIKRIWSEDAAFITVLFFPFYNSISYWGLGLLVALAAMKYVGKNSYFNAALFWFTCIWCAVYRLDLGFAFVASGIIALTIYIVANRNVFALKQLLSTLCIWGITGAAVWCGICVWKGINPIARLLEFLYISASNQNWAYPSLGDVSLTKFSFIYIFAPFSVIVTLLYAILGQNMKDRISVDKWVLLLIVGISYLCNFPRGLVRHSLADNTPFVCIWTGLFFLTLFVVLLKNNGKLFLPVFTICILGFALFQTDANFAEKSIADRAVGHVGDYTESWSLGRYAAPDGENPTGTYWGKIRKDQKVIERVMWNSDLKKTVQSFRTVLDELLNEDETFVDFINKTSIYPLLGRRNPVYVSQSPLQLSGEFTQERFIKEIEEVPIVLMPYDTKKRSYSGALDGVPNSYRYYKVAEHIYQNYVPLCACEDQYAVWCLKDRYEDMSKRVEILSEACKPIGYGYDGPYLQDDKSLSYLPYIHNYELSLLPAIWAEGDVKRSAENDVLQVLKKEGDFFRYSLPNTEYGKNGNYLKIQLNYNGTDQDGLINDNDETIEATIHIGTYIDGVFDTKYQYKFMIKEGMHEYMIRVSNDYYWYTGNTDAIKLESDASFGEIKMQILEGD